MEAWKADIWQYRGNFSGGAHEFLGMYTPQGSYEKWTHKELQVDVVGTEI